MLRRFYSLSLLPSRHAAALEENSHTLWFITKAHILWATLNPHVILLLRQIYLNLSANFCKYRLCCLRMKEAGNSCIREYKHHGFHLPRSCQPGSSSGHLKTPLSCTHGGKDCQNEAYEPHLSLTLMIRSAPNLQKWTPGLSSQMSLVIQGEGTLQILYNSILLYIKWCINVYLYPVRWPPQVWQRNIRLKSPCDVSIEFWLICCLPQLKFFANKCKSIFIIALPSPAMHNSRVFFCCLLKRSKILCFINSEGCRKGGGFENRVDLLACI